MPQNLVSFHFDPRKSGQIIKQLCKERGVSQASLAAQTGMSYDTITNCIGGKVQDLRFERVFKFCVVLGIPMEAYLLLMLKDEDIDFLDDVLLYDVKDNETTPATEIPAEILPEAVPDTVVAAVTAVADTTPDANTTPTLPHYARDDVSAYVAVLDKFHDARVADLKAHHAEHVESLRKGLHVRMNCIKILAALLVATIVALVVSLVVR